MAIDQKIPILKEKLEAWDRNKALSIIVSQVDPDALGSAFGLRYILNKFEINAQVYYSGSISHNQNKAIVNYFNLANQMKLFTDFDYESTYSFVDSSDVEDARLGLKSSLDLENLFLVVDHHRCDTTKLSTETSDPVLLIEELGSASTLIVEMLQKLEVEIEEDNKYIYVLLALGIYTDTNNLLKATKRDLEAFTYLQRFVDTKDTTKFVDYSLPPTFFNNLQSAMNSYKQNGSKALASLGFVNKKERDDISTICDLLLRREGVDFVAVWCIIGDSVHISFRSMNLSNPLDTFIKENFDNRGGAKLSPDGRGEGGANIPLGNDFWFGVNSKEVKLKLVSDRFSEIMLGEEK